MQQLLTSLVLLFICFSSQLNAAEKLTERSLANFSKLYIKTNNKEPLKLDKILSDKLIVETNIGAKVRRVTLFSGKKEYMAMISSEPYSGVYKFNNAKVVDIAITKNNMGKFKIAYYPSRQRRKELLTYSRVLRKKIWVTFFVEMQKSGPKVIKIIESV